MTLYERFAQFFEDNQYDAEDEDKWFEAMSDFVNQLPLEYKTSIINNLGGEDQARTKVQSGSDFTDEAVATVDGILCCMIQKGISVCY